MAVHPRSEGHAQRTIWLVLSDQHQALTIARARRTDCVSRTCRGGVMNCTYVGKRTDTEFKLADRSWMLHDFLTSNRDELIKRCRAKVAKRSPTIPAAIPAIAEKGVPLFLAQVVETLRREQLTAKRNAPEPEPTPAATEIGRAAAWHGADLLRRGYTVDQVVHDYGDVCQAVTDMVVEENASVSADEFRTLNRCLDNAIADAVTAYADGHEISIPDKAKKVHKDAGSLPDSQGRLVNLAIQTFAAIKTGSVGVNGATGKILDNTLAELRDLIEQGRPDNPVSGTSTPALLVAHKRAT